MARLRLIHSSNSCEDLMVKANIHLSKQRAEKALEVYTKIIYEVSPGNPCALLNRSLAYVVLGYPELAVTDAYRAATFIYDLDIYDMSGKSLKEDMTADRFLIRTIAKYLRTEQIHIQAGDRWKMNLYHNSKWLKLSMANIMLGVPFVVTTNSGIPWKALELLAVFRLCGALWCCGGGAMSDALGMIDDTLARGKYDPIDLDSDVRKQFVKLGNLIMEDVEDRFSKDPTSLKASMWTKATLVNRVVYPWNHHEYNKNVFREVQDLEAYVGKVAKSCSAQLQSSFTSSCLRLVAAKDIYPNETVLLETSALQVTASVADNGTPSFYCEACAALLVTTNEYRQRTFASKPPSPSSPPYDSPKAAAEDFYIPVWTTSPANHTPAVPVDHGTLPGFSGPTPSSQVPPNDVLTSPPRSEFPRSKPESPTGNYGLAPELSYCNDCKMVYYCSRECYNAAGFHDPICNKEVESEIRLFYLAAAQKLARTDPENYADINFIHPKERCLCDLLLVRILGKIYIENVHPLDLNDVRWLGGGLLSPGTLITKYHNKESVESEMDPPLYSPSLTAELQSLKQLPWTFMNNVIRPIQYIKQLGFDQSEHLTVKDFDGWVINTLYAKIMESTRISQGPRQVKVYNDDGVLVCKESPESRKGDQSILTGVISPVFDMVGIADPSNAETPNVDVTDCGTVRCVARPTEEEHNKDDVGGESTGMDLSEGNTVGGPTSPTQRPRIKAGERILRLGPSRSSRSRVSSMGSWIDRMSDNLSLSDSISRVLTETKDLRSSPRGDTLGTDIEME